MKIMKCTLDLNRCDYYDTYKVNDLCAKIAMTNAMWSPYVNSIHPALVCPIQAVIFANVAKGSMLTITIGNKKQSLQGAYKIVNGTFDYTMASRLPIDGNRWITDMKVFETLANNNGTTGKPAGKRTQVWCLDSDVRITLSKNTRSRKRNWKHAENKSIIATRFCFVGGYTLNVSTYIVCNRTRI